MTAFAEPPLSLLDVRERRQVLPDAPAGRCRTAGRARRLIRGRIRRMRRPRRSVRRRKVVDPAHGLRQLRRRRRRAILLRDPEADVDATISARASRAWCSAYGARSSIAYVSQFLRAVPRVSGTRRRGRTAAGTWPRPGSGAARGPPTMLLPAEPAECRYTTCRPRRFPAARNSASTSPAASLPTILSCCSTSRRPLLTPTNRDVVVAMIGEKLRRRHRHPGHLPRCGRCASSVATRIDRRLRPSRRGRATSA